MNKILESTRGKRWGAFIQKSGPVFLPSVEEVADWLKGQGYEVVGKKTVILEGSSEGQAETACGLIVSTSGYARDTNPGEGK